MRTGIFFGILFLLTLTVSAQVELRPFVGFNSSNLTKDISEAEFKNDLGYQVGIDLQIGNRVYLQPGLSFEIIKNKVSSNVIDLDAGLKMNRIRVPLLIGFRLFESSGESNFNLRGFTGPNFSYTISKDLDDDFLIDKDDFKDAVWGWNAGAGLDISIFFVDVGYSFGLSEVIENIENSSPRNNIFYGNAGMRVRF